MLTFLWSRIWQSELYWTAYNGVKMVRAVYGRNVAEIKAKNQKSEHNLNPKDKNKNKNFNKSPKISLSIKNT